MKRNIKRVAYIMVVLVVMGMSGLLAALIDFNARYQEKHQAVDKLTNQLSHLEKEIQEHQEKLAYYDLLQFKNSAYTQRFPIFSDILNTVYYKSFQYGFEPDLVLKVIKVESDFNPNAISYMGAYGLMQVNLAVWQAPLRIDRSRIFDVSYNIDLGLQILHHYYKESAGNLNRALHLYNNGYRYQNNSYSAKVENAPVSTDASSGAFHSRGL